VLQESRYIPWNEWVREKSMQIWQPNCNKGPPAFGGKPR
jgi:hypothetical protein